MGTKWMAYKNMWLIFLQGSLNDMKLFNYWVGFRFVEKRNRNIQYHRAEEVVFHIFSRVYVSESIGGMRLSSCGSFVVDQRFFQNFGIATDRALREVIFLWSIGKIECVTDHEEDYIVPIGPDVLHSCRRAPMLSTQGRAVLFRLGIRSGSQFESVKVR